MALGENTCVVATEVYRLRRACWENGYRPLAVYSPGAQVRGTLIRGAGKRPVGNDWLERALEDPPTIVAGPHRVSTLALNTGLLTGQLSGLDVDVLLPEVVDQIVSRIEKALGPTPLSRVGRAPKILLCYHAVEPFAKLSTRDYQMPDGSKGHFEILGHGQQAVAFGIHPDTLAPYRWLDRSPTDMPLTALPAITFDQACQLIDEIEATLQAAGGIPFVPPRILGTPPAASLSAGNGFFRAVNNAALDRIEAWAPSLHRDFHDREFRAVEALSLRGVGAAGALPGRLAFRFAELFRAQLGRLESPFARVGRYLALPVLSGADAALSAARSAGGRGLRASQPLRDSACAACVGAHV